MLRADGGASRPEVSALLRGAGEVARRATMFNQPDVSVHLVLVNGTAGAVVPSDGGPVSVMGFTISGGRITEIDILLDPERLRLLDVAGILLSQAEAGLAVEQLTGDLQMARASRRYRCRWPSSFVLPGVRPGTTRTGSITHRAALRR